MKRSGRGNQAGFSYNMELYFIVMILGLTAAIGIPMIKKLLKPPVDENCLKNMAKIVLKGGEVTGKCPASGELYGLVKDAMGREILACPAPEAHLDYRPRFVRERGFWRFEADLPAEPLCADGLVSKGCGGPVLASQSGNSILISVKTGGFFGRLFASIGILFVGCLLSLAAVALLPGWPKKREDDHASMLKRSARMLGRLIARIMVVIVWSAALTAFALMLLLVVAPWSTEHFAITRNSGQLYARETIAGFNLAKPHLKTGIMGVYPLRKGKKCHEIVLILERPGQRVRLLKLFGVSNRCIGLAEKIDDALLEQTRLK